MKCLFRGLHEPLLSVHSIYCFHHQLTCQKHFNFCCYHSGWCEISLLALKRKFLSCSFPPPERIKFPTKHSLEKIRFLLLPTSVFDSPRKLFFFSFFSYFLLMAETLFFSYSCTSVLFFRTLILTVVVFLARFFFFVVLGMKILANASRL